ncbi:efflux RND transporter periplasmic adaptor subunit [Alkaliphilus peptidifermentans]|uniref:RND family efflux transporter, MFP subunit n=1 Tax=Alkaliphilus peptidifermentans DSM 18978 TaxID=1120976 RepID=A0A1G5K2J5_9FIRM|nr:efflux RND transporter periplasmic adaptor subunit [Alkaliphilus peptidifermentans]SCY94865.1 RND family efflux transporter, MFP subunit [Alkaliphilus peptidifermentans DSM 18978]
MDSNFKKKIIIIIIVLGISSIQIGCRNQENESQETKVAIEVIELTKGQIKSSVTLSTQLMPIDSVMIVAKTPGLKVTRLGVKVGDIVTEGSFLFELDKTMARKQVDQAKTNYDMARKNYQQQKQFIDYENEKLEEQIQVYLDYSNKMKPFMNVEDTIPQHTVPNEVPLQGAEIQLDQARAGYSNALQQLEEFDYYSPIEGVVSQLNITENQVALGAQPAVIIANTNSLKAMLQVNSSLLSKLKVGQEIIVKFKELENIGKITSINSIADQRHGLFTVEIAINNTEGIYTSGTFATVDIILDEKEEAIIIPKEAMKMEEELAYVFIVEEGKAKKIHIKTGIDGGDVIEVEEGLSVGDKVVIKGQHYVEDKTPVMVRGDVDEDN